MKVKDEGFITELLSKNLLDEYGMKEFRYCDQKVLRSHLRKTVIEYNIKFSNSSTKTYIGVHRESDKRLEYVFSTLHHLRSSGFNEESDLRVPEPILYLPSLSFLLMEQAEGKLLGTLLAQEETTSLTPYVEGAAKWLAKLHNNKSINTTRVHSFEDEIATSIKFKRALLNIFPTLSKKIVSISELMVRMQTEEARKKKKEKKNSSQYNDYAITRLIHGDYHPKNIFASSTNIITVIDFEESRMGDPAFDVGYFIAQMKMSYGFKPAIIGAADMFLDKYLQETDYSYDSHHDLEKRERIYEAQTYFQRIYHTYWLLKLKPDINLVSRWLTESEKCLEKAGEQVS